MQAMFGWVGNHTSGLFADEQEVIADADMSGEKSIENTYARQSGNVPSSLALMNMTDKGLHEPVHSVVDYINTLYCWCADCQSKTSYRELLRAQCTWLYRTTHD